MIRHVAFVQMIPVLGTAQRQDQFAWPEWEIKEQGHGVVELRRPAAQNVEEVPRFAVKGVGYCLGGMVPWTELPDPLAAFMGPPDDAEQGADTRDDPSPDAPESTGVGAGGRDERPAPQGAKQAEGRKARSRRKVKT